MTMIYNALLLSESKPFQKNNVINYFFLFNKKNVEKNTA